MSGLVEFLRARLDADAAYVEGGTCNCWQPTDNGKCGNLPDCPARVLAEVEAGRRLIRAHDKWCQGECEATYPNVGSDAAYYWEIKNRAAVYVDHPDYDESWRP